MRYSCLSPILQDVCNQLFRTRHNRGRSSRRIKSASAGDFADSVLKSIVKAAASDDEISLAGFGKFKIRLRQNARAAIRPTVRKSRSPRRRSSPFACQGSEGRLERLNAGIRLIGPFWQLGSSEFTNFEDAVETRNALVHRRIPPGQAAEQRECKTRLGSREAGAAGKR